MKKEFENSFKQSKNDTEELTWWYIINVYVCRFIRLLKKLSYKSYLKKIIKRNFMNREYGGAYRFINKKKLILP